MNRNQRRALTIRDPKGAKLEPMLLFVQERDKLGRPTVCRVTYDDETIGDVVQGAKNPQALLVWAPPWRPS